MICIPPEPNPGDKVSANLIGQIIRCIRQLRPIDSPTVVSSTGPNGTVYRSAATKKARVKHQEDVGCYSIVEKEVEAAEEGSDSEGSVSISFGNNYYRCAGKTYEGVDTFSCELPAIIALKIDLGSGGTPDSEFERYTSIEDMIEAEEDQRYYIIPLYEFSSLGEVLCDFRNIPVSVMFEFPNTSE